MSDEVDKWLTPLELDYLCHVGDKEKSGKCFRTKINKNVIAVTYIKPVQDEYYRRDVWNHTILIPYQEYFEDREPEPSKLVAPHFLSPGTRTLGSLEPLKI